MKRMTLPSGYRIGAITLFRKLKGYVDPGSPGRDWNLATGMVIEGKAAFQMMGDWAKGEFLKAGKKPGADFVCIRFPGTQLRRPRRGDCLDLSPQCFPLILQTGFDPDHETKTNPSNRYTARPDQ